MSVINQSNLLKCQLYIIEDAIIISKQSLHYSLKFFMELRVENGFIGTGCWFDMNCRKYDFKPFH
jgi:hypothetical protein